MITVFSLRGGSGTTLLAVNIAAVLAQMLELEIPLVDLALETGSASILLDVLPRLTLSHLAKEDLSNLDTGILKEYFATHPSGVRLVAAPTTPVLAEVVTPTLVNHLLNSLRVNYSHVVVDTSHTLGELPLAALDASDVILLVVPPDMVSLKSASGALETFASLGYPETRTLVVMNWVFPRRGLPQKELEAALARPIDAAIPYGGEAAIRSINEGVPLVLSQPSLAWSQAVEALAYRVCSTESRAVAEAIGNKRFAAIKKRVPA